MIENSDEEIYLFKPKVNAKIKDFIAEFLIIAMTKR